MLALDAKESTGDLSAAEAARRLHTEGPTELPTSQRRTILAIAWEDVREPMFPLLVAAGTLHLFLGNLREALVLLGSVVLVRLKLLVDPEHRLNPDILVSLVRVHGRAPLLGNQTSVIL